MRLISWNVNGLRACAKKGFAESMARLDPDAICLQEVKMSEPIDALVPEGYAPHWCFAEKKGYSGTAIFTKREPIDVTRGLGLPEYDREGRLIAAEYADFTLITCYAPNAQSELQRMEYRMGWEDALRGVLRERLAEKPVVLCGDMNVAHMPIDLKHPASNRQSAGFTDQERGKFGELLGLGFTDTLRHFHPDEPGLYTWWAYTQVTARERNVGWRIDYFLASDALMPRVQGAAIHPDIMGSDHCPTELTLGDGGTR